MTGLGVGEVSRVNPYSSDLNPAKPHPSSKLPIKAPKGPKKTKECLKGHKRAHKKLEYDWVGGG